MEQIGRDCDMRSTEGRTPHSNYDKAANKQRLALLV